MDEVAVTGQAAAGPGRSARKRQVIIDTATALFLRNGYHSTSMDQIAADAAVSKQTVYKNFADKEQLFSGIVLGVTGNSNAIISELTSVLDSAEITTADDLRAVLTGLARRYIDAVLQPHVLALRRLVIAEAERFPDLARSYYEQAPARAIELIAQHLRAYVERGMLQADDTYLAAAHFAYLALAIPQDKAQFCPHQPLSPAERERIASEAVRVFFAAYQHPATVPGTTPMPALPGKAAAGLPPRIPHPRGLAVRHPEAALPRWRYQRIQKYMPARSAPADLACSDISPKTMLTSSGSNRPYCGPYWSTH